MKGNILGLKPTMKTLKSLQSLKIIPGLTTVVVKVDGEFTKISYSQGEVYTINRWGHKRSNFPALTEFEEAMERANVKSAEILCELYAVENENPLKLPNFLHCIKSGDEGLLKKVRVGVWDLVSINGHAVKENYAWRLEEASKWFNGCKMVKVLDHIIPKTLKEVENFWRIYVEEKKYEGIVIRNNSEILKLKPIKELDAVIVGINKYSSFGRSNLFAQKEVTTVKLALMDDDGSFVELGDCASGIDVALRSALWQLMDYKVQEDEKTVWIKPMVVCQIEYTDTFESVNRKMRFEGEKYQTVGTVKLVKLRHPRLLRFRGDKGVSAKDIGLQQIP